MLEGQRVEMTPGQSECGCVTVRMPEADFVVRLIY
jgi:hypothetical protein